MSLSAAPGDDQPPMRPRSILLDLFGDYLRYAEGEVMAGRLVELLASFGVEEATSRVTLSRLRKEGWFTTRRLGRETAYELSPNMLGVLDEGRERIFADYEEVWDGKWTTLIQQNDNPDRLTRDRLRRELTWQGLGQLTTSTWMTPRDVSHRVRAMAQSYPEVTFTILRSETAGLEHDLALVSRCWDLPVINEAYRAFLSRYSPLMSTAQQLAGPAALVARTEVIAAYRHFPFADPGLPDELRPEGWLGSDANRTFRECHLALREAADAYVETVIGSRLDAPNV